MVNRSRYKWLVVDGKRLTLIIMDEGRDRYGRTVFHLPKDFQRYTDLAGIEMPDADYNEVAVYLQNKWKSPDHSPVAYNHC